MPRPRICRRVRGHPGFVHFKPAGITLRGLAESVISVDEYEAIRLKDLEDLDQGAAAREMGISQPTFHRLVVSARKKLADAIVHGKAIRIEGGDYRIHHRYGGGHNLCICPKCGFEQEHRRGRPCLGSPCPRCGTMMEGK